MILIYVFLLQYLKEDYGNQHTYQKNLIYFVQNSMTASIENKQTRQNLYKLLTETINIFGCLNCYKVCKFISEHLKYSISLPFLQMIKILLQKIKTIKISEDFFLRIIENLYKYIINSTNTENLYNIQKAITEIIIKISELSKSDLKRQIFNFLDQKPNQYHECLLSVTLYQQVNQALKSIVLPFFIKKSPPKYEYVLDKYSSIYIKFQKYTGPFQLREFLWDLIVIRNALVIDRNSVYFRFGNKIADLLNKMVKYIILDILPDQCADIIELIIQRLRFLQPIQVSQIRFSSIFKELGQELEQHSIQIKVIQHLKKIISEFNHRFEQTKLEGTGLMLQLIIVLQRTSERADLLPLDFLDSLTSLIILTLPQNISKENVPELNKILLLLIYVIRKRSNLSTFNLFMTLVNKTLSLSRESVLNTSSRLLAVNEQFKQFVRDNLMFSNLLASYNTHIQIMRTGRFHQQSVNQLWKNLQETPSIHQLQS